MMHHRERPGIRPPRGRWARRAAVGLGVLVLLAAGGELTLRLVGGPDGSQMRIKKQIESAGTTYAPDRELGALLAANRTDTLRTPDHTFVLQTDHAGFPNPDPWPDHADIAVLGNSLLEGAGVGAEGRYTSLLERALPGRTVLNFALPGGGTQHELLVYRRFVQPLQPRLVIATVWIVWDVENTRQFAHWLMENRPDSDYTHYRFTYGETHRRRVPHRPSTLDRIRSAATGWLGRSYLVSAAYRKLKSMTGGSLLEGTVVLPADDTVFLSIRYQRRLAQGLDRSATPDMRELIFRPLQEMQREVEARGGRFLVVLMPSKEEVYAVDNFPPVLRTIREARAELESRGLPVLDLYPAFRRRGARNAAFYPADMHPNELGNRIMADVTEQWIREHGVFADASSAPAQPRAADKEGVR